jgi:hypothetical protein
MVKYRHLAWVIVFTLITFGIYGIYWLVMTTLELKELKSKSAPNPWWILWMIVFSIIGMAVTVFTAFGWIFYIISIIISVYFYWNYSKAVYEVSKKFHYILLFVFFIIFGLISIILTQIVLNERAGKKKK